MASVSASIPIDMLDKLDELVRKGEYASVSTFIREAVAKYIRELEQKSE